jgi:hypothetical protein
VQIRAAITNGVRHLMLAALLALCACGGNPPKKPVVPAGGSNEGAVAPGEKKANPAIAPAPAGKPGGGAHTPAPVVLRTIGCPVPTCVLHPNHGTYFTCLNGGAGTCFHFGGPCVPDGGCMYDASSSSYKTCSKPGEGTCLAFGAACAPANKCMFSSADNLYHHCDDVDAGRGTCKKFGALCTP